MFNFVIFCFAIFISALAAPLEKFSSFPQERTTESRLEFEDEKIEVKRAKGERDSIVLGKLLTTDLEAEAEGEKFLYSIKQYLQQKKNLYPILQKETSLRKPLLLIENFEEMKSNGIDYIITGTFQILSLRESLTPIKIKIFIWDTYEKSKILEHEFVTTKENLENFTKEFVTQIYEFITGDFGFFYGKLLYSLQAENINFKKIIVSAAEKGVVDGLAFTDGKHIAFSPKYCKSEREIMYVSQKRGKPSRISLLKAATGITERLVIPEFEKELKHYSLFSPSFSRDCSKIVFSATQGDSTNIFLFNREDKKLTQLTHDSTFINTSPAFFADDTKIIFVSDRTGNRPKIFQMDINGNVKFQLIHGEGSYFSPSVSRDGKKIAFSKSNGGKFFLGMAHSDGTYEKEIFSAFLIEAPSWTPIGKNIIFSMKEKRNSPSRIFTISLNSFDLQELPALNGNASEGSWIDEL